MSALLLEQQSAMAPCNCGVLGELVDYMNERMARFGSGSSEPCFSAQTGQLVVRGTRVEVDVGPFTLRTETHRISAVSALARPVAYYSALRVTTQHGREIGAEALLRLQSSDAAAVAMDRLYRVLHMLNHLGCGREQLDLWVHTSLRHVLAVEGRHGAFFEDVLARCGLGAERIVLIVPLLPSMDPDFGRLVRACDEYRSRGFRLALDMPTAAMSSLDAAHTLGATWVRARERDVAALREAGLTGPLLVRDLGRQAGSTAPFLAEDLVELYDSRRPVFLA